MSEQPKRCVTSTYLSRNLGAVLHDVMTHKQTILVTTTSRPQVMIVNVEAYEALLAATREMDEARRAE